MSSKLTRGLQATVDNTPIEDGKMRFANDTGRLYIDTANDRVQITDVVFGLTYAEVVALENPLPKLYLTSDFHQVMSYDFAEEEWIIYGGGYSPAMVIIDEYFNDDGDLVLMYGDGHTKKLDMTTSEKVVVITEKVNTLEEKMTEFESAIELIKSEL